MYFAYVKYDCEYWWIFIYFVSTQFCDTLYNMQIIYHSAFGKKKEKREKKNVMISGLRGSCEETH